MKDSTSENTDSTNSVDPLSDEACIQWMRDQNMPPLTMYPLRTWQEAAKRACDKISVLEADNQRLRELLREVTDAYEGCAIHIEPPKPHHSGCIVCIRIAKARAALEGT